MRTVGDLQRLRVKGRRDHGKESDSASNLHVSEEPWKYSPAHTPASASGLQSHEKTHLSRHLVCAALFRQPQEARADPLTTAWGTAATMPQTVEVALELGNGLRILRHTREKPRLP